MAEPTTRSKQFFVEALYRPRDKVKLGPHQGTVARILIADIGVTYEVYWWAGDEQKVGTAYEWELELVEEASDD
jgi:hypothetical protein